MRLSLIFCLLLALAPIASADLIIPDRRQEAAQAEGGEQWLPTALVGLACGVLVILCVTIARRKSSKTPTGGSP
jgi:hypothetical protein